MIIQKHTALVALLKSIEDKTSFADIDINEFMGRVNNKKLVVFFYIDNNNSDCISECNNFSLLYSKFKSYNTEVIGISQNSTESHAKFKKSENIHFILVSDSNCIVSDAFQVINRRKFLGFKNNQAERATFIFNKQGMLYLQWKPVDLYQHAVSVLSFAKAI
jgi:peroxiredoxin Q/BCP